MEDFKLEYSWSNGKYWSPYDHCRVWSQSNDGSSEYTLKVRDQYGQEVMTEIVVTNAKDRILETPVIITNKPEGQWNTGATAYIEVTDPNKNRTYYKGANDSSWLSGNMGTLVDGDSSIEFYYDDIYGNKSPVVGVYLMADSTKPTNLNFVPKVDSAGRILTEVSAVKKWSPLRYSISYDDGATWSEPQIGGKFCLTNTSGQNEYMVNCRAYNSSQEYNETTQKYEYVVYTEGTPIRVVIK